MIEEVEKVARWLRTYKLNEVEVANPTEDGIIPWDKCSEKTKARWLKDAKEFLSIPITKECPNCRGKGKVGVHSFATAEMELLDSVWRRVIMNNEAVEKVDKLYTDIWFLLKDESQPVKNQVMKMLGYRLIPKELKGLSDEEIKKVIKEYGFSRNVAYEDNYYTMNIREFEEVVKATLEAIKKQIEDFNK